MLLARFPIVHGNPFHERVEREREREEALRNADIVFSPVDLRLPPRCQDFVESPNPVCGFSTPIPRQSHASHPIPLCQFPLDILENQRENTVETEETKLQKVAAG